MWRECHLARVHIVAMSCMTAHMCCNFLFSITTRTALATCVPPPSATPPTDDVPFDTGERAAAEAGALALQVAQRKLNMSSNPVHHIGAPADAPLVAVPRNSALTRYAQFLEQAGLPDGDEAQTVHQVHEDLRLVRKWSDVQVRPGVPATITGVAPAHLDAVFPRSERADRTRVVLPIASDASLTVAELHALCSRASHAHRCVTLALVDDDSTTAYYRAFTTWNEIVHPQWKMKRERAPNAASEDDESSDDMEDATE